MWLFLKKGKNEQKIEKKINKQTTTKQTKSATIHNSPYLHHRWRCYQAIYLRDQQEGSTYLTQLPS